MRAKRRLTDVSSMLAPGDFHADDVRWRTRERVTTSTVGIPEALSLIRDGEMARAMRLLHSNGVAGLTARILGQLAQKHPERSHAVPQTVPGLQAVRVRVELREVFRKLRRRAGQAGPAAETATNTCAH